MAEWPRYPADVIGGDEPTHSPTKNQNTLLAALRGSQFAKRLETDDSNNLYVRIAADDAGIPGQISALVVGAATNVSANSQQTIATYTATGAHKISRIVVSGTDYAKYQIYLNAVLIETRRTGPSRNLEFDFISPLSMADADVLDVKVTHYITGDIADFESTIYGV